MLHQDPGLVRKYHHARSRKWTFCDHCQSFRPPKTVHCSTCQVCIAEYDHHCPVCILQIILLSLRQTVLIFSALVVDWEVRRKRESSPLPVFCYFIDLVGCSLYRTGHISRCSIALLYYIHYFYFLLGFFIYVILRNTENDQNRSRLK